MIWYDVIWYFIFYIWYDIWFLIWYDMFWFDIYLYIYICVCDMWKHPIYMFFIFLSNRSISSHETSLFVSQRRARNRQEILRQQNWRQILQHALERGEAPRGPGATTGNGWNIHEDHRTTHRKVMEDVG